MPHNSTCRSMTLIPTGRLHPHALSRLIQNAMPSGRHARYACDVFDRCVLSSVLFGSHTAADTRQGGPEGEIRREYTGTCMHAAETGVAKQRGDQSYTVLGELLLSYQLFSPCNRVWSYALHYWTTIAVEEEHSQLGCILCVHMVLVRGEFEGCAPRSGG
ncbi:hypothetical protein BU25DRAFT_419720 [Macroventuria anomochaeta]|uniref:Uncharacterized protein n=1 Tax=Macroventuria anomochaeta TaxID=301207 RepID=A0ACB6S720_9PLEO|nr:uncharacterized protein BU25DRAFT_419720 [Macroventuria anomochaeta]KAF2630081.1 hypothetical protein BU25DRAFT_419720 [Macroventuria anomochaeta]